MESMKMETARRGKIKNSFSWKKKKNDTSPKQIKDQGSESIHDAKNAIM